MITVDPAGVNVAGYVVVAGPQSSGTRLLSHILRCGHIQFWHDKTHGTGLLLNPVKVIAIIREEAPTLLSRNASFAVEDRIERTVSINGILHKYPDAHWISYEALCAQPDSHIAVLADLLEVSPWTVEFDIVDQNGKWADGIGGPQMPELFPV